MRLKYIFPILFVLLTVSVFYITASEHDYVTYSEAEAHHVAPQQNNGDRRMVDMIADDSYLIEKGDSTIFILVGNFAAHHNGAVILADSAVRYSNQSFECFGHVLINQNSTYAYGDRAAYNRINSSVTLFSDLIKVVDGEAVMYTYECTFDTAKEVGRFGGGCYVEKGESLMEADRGYYYTDTHELIAVDNVEMRDATYQMTGDSIIFNTQTEDARYFTNTNIWNNKEEYLFANEGSYTKARDLHNLTRDAYILSPEREIWSDSLEYNGADSHIIGRSNIQVDESEQMIMGFADYGEWWDEPGNALFTRRPSMINYDPEQGDSLYLAADTMWLYTIAVLPPEVKRDTTSTEENMRGEDAAMDRSTERGIPEEEATNMETDEADEANIVEESAEEEGADDQISSATASFDTTALDNAPGEDTPFKGEERALNNKRNRNEENKGAEPRATNNLDPSQTHKAPNRDISARMATDTTQISAPREQKAAEEMAEEMVVTDSASMVEAIDSLAADSTLLNDTIPVPTKRQIRYRAKMEKRRVRDSILAIERAIRDSIDSIRMREEDSIQQIRDSLLRIKVDSIIAKRIEKSSRIADEEAARIARIKQQSIEREHRKIDKAKARAARRGREYTGPDYTIDSMAADSTLDSIQSQRREAADSMARDSLNIDSLAVDSLAVDSLALDSLNTEPPFPADSTYKMIKAYRRVRMYRTDTQLVCDSLTLLNTDSIIRLYRDPILWSEGNQVTSDSMAIYTRNEAIDKVHFMGDPIMGIEIDTMYYNQVKGREMMAYFADGNLQRNDVNGNAQTIYYLQDEGSTDVNALMYIESAGISFYLVDGGIDKIAYKQNPEYVIYPMTMIPETQKLRLDNFEWHNDKRPSRDSIIDRTIRPTRREDAMIQQKPRFRITERINYDRRRLTENRMWEDRVDELSPEIIEWRDSRPSNQKR
ncbi:MAG: hypothetical protein J6V26_01465 [Alistipes sp.]|nr:hypothetical protein [Alistipes sp.]